MRHAGSSRHDWIDATWMAIAAAALVIGLCCGAMWQEQRAADRVEVRQ